MRVTLTMTVTLLAGALACTDDTGEVCPIGVIERRPFEGPSVRGNSLDCALESPCEIVQSQVWVHVDSRCERLVVEVYDGNIFYGQSVYLYPSPDERASFAEIVHYSDVEPFETKHAVTGGWIALEKWDDDVVVGRFLVEDDRGGGMRGDFDTRIEPPERF